MIAQIWVTLSDVKLVFPDLSVAEKIVVLSVWVLWLWRAKVHILISGRFHRLQNYVNFRLFMRAIGAKICTFLSVEKMEKVRHTFCIQWIGRVIFREFDTICLVFLKKQFRKIRLYTATKLEVTISEKWLKTVESHGQHSCLSK